MFRFALLLALKVVFVGACDIQNAKNFEPSLLGLDTEGFAYQLEGVCVEDDEECKKYLQNACDLGNFRYCAMLGAIYVIDRYDSIDKEAQSAKARALFQKACDGKNGSGCFMLNVNSDKDKNSQYIRLACEYGEFVGCYKIVLDSKNTLENLKLNKAYEDIEATKAYKDTTKTIICGYERTLALVKAECENATSNYDTISNEYKTLQAQNEHSDKDFDEFHTKTKEMKEKIKRAEYFKNYCDVYKAIKNGYDNFLKSIK